MKTFKNEHKIKSFKGTVGSRRFGDWRKGSVKTGTFNKELDNILNLKYI